MLEAKIRQANKADFKAINDIYSRMVEMEHRKSKNIL